MNKLNIALISDSHGNMAYVQKFLSQLQGKEVHLVMHLGDYYRDALPIQESGYPLIRVPGTWTPYYQDHMIDNRRFETFLDWRFFLTHTPEKDMNDLPEDLDPKKVIHENMAHVFLHGHTHKADVSEENGVIIINPGHTKEESDRGKPPSYGWLELTKERLKITIKQLLTQDMMIEKEFLKKAS